MKQLSIAEKDIVALDYTSRAFSSTVNLFRPILWRNRELFCRILGPDDDMRRKGLVLRKMRRLESGKPASMNG